MRREGKPNFLPRYWLYVLAGDKLSQLASVKLAKIKPLKITGLTG